METKVHETVDNVEKLEQALVRTRASQQIYNTYSQAQIDRILRAAA